MGLRQLNGIVAGIGCMAAPRFMIYNALGAALWVAVWGLGVYWFGGHIHALVGVIGPIGFGALAATFFILGGLLLWRRHQRVVKN